MIPLEGALITIRVNKPNADEISIHPEYGDAWKINGSKEGQTVWALDQLQDDFSAVIQILSEFVDETSVWVNSDTGKNISAWEAVTLLTSRGDTRD